ncbi:MAG: DNA alkylation repair protein, partial [Saprospiraceae bacterium]
GEDLKALVRLCLADDHRELHYFALETVQKNLKKQPADFLDFLEELIVTRSWWDTVDWLAKLVGMHLLRFPALQQPASARWLASDNLWLQRISMIFQLAYRDKTDAVLLFHNIRQLACSKEFFIQKGAGWALRQYSKIDPSAVRAFVESHSLAPLTRREALKWLQKNA